jgi:hypothetical protein
VGIDYGDTMNNQIVIARYAGDDLVFRKLHVSAVVEQLNNTSSHLIDADADANEKY